MVRYYSVARCPAGETFFVILSKSQFDVREKNMTFEFVNFLFYGLEDRPRKNNRGMFMSFVTGWNRLNKVS